ncbi:uncharacterized protein RHOBADRAFT_44032 [Rhodotorula graminis WP1]|uniref:BAG domain-containing protein n=1 Tax=Rhodotorula graminis (strain WP1) TaxID=578459 RepID=A0A194S4T7_RHOGW|nr:uncharacterized protein RHOBADRAFT_44032 [Rhodotorula graminis WP1]KPV75525.1 hypothetical protein RHOBADRAFT_44032 [Rhodotorula graminis WP1]
MFAFAHPHSHSYSPSSPYTSRPTFLELVPSSLVYERHPHYHHSHDYLADQRRRQRQLALKEAEAAERRRRIQEDLEVAAYRAAVAAEVEHRRRQAAYAREQRRRQDDRRRLVEARRARQRHVHPYPRQLLDLVFQHLDAAALDDDEHADEHDESSDDDEQQLVHLVPLGAPDLSEHDEASAASSASDSASDLDMVALVDESDDDSDAEMASSPSRDSALSTLASLASEFASRRSAFTSPSTLTFSPSPSPADRATRSPTPPLAFGRANAVFLGYEEALLALLTRIDAVESGGDDGVRRTRKELVRAIEDELARLDGIKARAWEEQSGSSAGESDADDESTEHDADDAEDVLELSSSSDSDIDTFPTSSTSHARRNASTKVPFVAPSSTSRHTRFASPALSSTSTSSSAADPVDEPLNAGSDDVASLLLDVHKAHDEFDEMSDDERERLEMEALRAADRESDGDDKQDLDGDEEGVWVYC